MRRPALAVAALLCAPCSAQWSTATLSEARFLLGAASVDSYAVFAGGGSTGGDVFDLYDAATGTWSAGSLSQPSRLSGASAGGLALFTGGSDIEVFDAATGTWSTIPDPHWAGARPATSVGDEVLFGGTGWGTGTPTDRVDIYDTVSGTWSLEHLSVARVGLAATSVGSLALFAGGGVSATAFSLVDILDTATGTWSTASLSQARWLLAATSVGGKAFFAGGASSANDRVDIYDAATGTWSQESLPLPRIFLTATSVGRFALFAGGATSTSWDDISDRVDIYDTLAGTWSTATLSEPRLRLASTTVGHLAIFAGGQTNVGYSDAVDIFDAQLGTMYCIAAPNSTGLPGLMRAEGSTLVSVNDLTLIAEQLPPGQFGYFITGLTQGFIQPPGSQGSICLSGNIGRYNRASEIIQGPAGSLQLDLASMPVNPPLAAMPGDTWNFQCWYRDVNPGPTSNTTGALAMTFATTGVPSVQFAVTQASIIEDTTLLEVRLTLSQPADQDVLVTYASGGTATVDVDWRVEEPNPFVIPAGQTWADMTLVIAEDTAQESDESAIVSLGAPVGAVLGTATTFTLTIVDDD